MTKVEDLRKLKDQATKMVEKRHYDKAAALYAQIAEREPDPDWYQRAGEAYRRAGDAARAVESLKMAADRYANGGFLLKAIAVCKSILQVDPKETAMQARLAELYAKRDVGAPAKPAAPPMLHPPTHRPAPAVVAPARIAVVPMPVAVVPVPVAAVTPTPAAPAQMVVEDSALPPMVVEDPALSPFEPMEALALRDMLGVRKQEPQLATDDDLELDAEPEMDMPGVYEISLDEEEVAIEVERAPVAAEPLLRVDEADFSGLTDEADFHDVATRAAPPRGALPKIPLFSSLAEEDLRELIERMELQDVAAGQPIVKEGDRGGSLYVLASGEARVLVGDVEVARLASGAFFGEVGLFTDDPRTATVEAVGDCAVLELRRELAWELARRSPEVLRTLVSFLRDRLLERLLTGSPLFAELSPTDARVLAAEFIFLELDAGATPVKQGERSPGMFFLMSGVAEAVRDGQRLAELRAGEVFGERSLLLRAPASADVRAVKRCWALLLPRDRFQEIMLSYPQVLAYVSELAEKRDSLTSQERSTERRIQLS